MSVVHANGIRQCFRREGDRRLPALVLVHPIGFDHALWDRVVPHLNASFQVIRPDLRGHGGSQVTAEPYSVQGLAQDLRALLDTLGIAQFCIAGTSLGGLVGLQLALDLPGRVPALVVANASARLPLPAEEWNRRIALALASGTEAFVSGVTERMFTAAFRATDDPFFHTLLESLRAMDARGYAAALAALRDADLLADLPHVSVPTLVIAGENDAAVPREHAEHLASGIVGARLAVLPGGHLSAVESPVAFADALLQFLPR